MPPAPARSLRCSLPVPLEQLDAFVVEDAGPTIARSQLSQFLAKWDGVFEWADGADEHPARLGNSRERHNDISRRDVSTERSGCGDRCVGWDEMGCTVHCVNFVLPVGGEQSPGE